MLPMRRRLRVIEVADDLGIGGAVEDGSLVFQLAAQLDGIGQVAVVAQCHGAAAVPDDHGLCIGATRLPAVA